MTSTVEKRCACGPARWPKCPDAWYLKTFRYGGRAYEPNLTRWAAVTLQRTIATKTEAEGAAELLRTAIRAGRYQSVKAVRQTEPAAVAPPAPRGVPTVAVLLQAFEAAQITPDPEKRPRTKLSERACLTRFAAWVPAPGERPLGDRPVAAIDLALLIAFRRAPPLGTAPASTWAKYRTLLGQFFRWAKWEGHRDTDPFAEARPDQLKALRRGKTAKRQRRLRPGEEQALLAVASPWWRGVLVAALETALRLGELLALQWRDVDLDAGILHVRAEAVGASKTGTARDVPISAALRVVLAERPAVDPAGDAWGPRAYVFGNAIGEPLGDVQGSWATLVLKAHGAPPSWNPASGLTAASQAALKAIDLHFHDLRHEAASRWLERGVYTPFEVQQLLGHATLAQTSTYLNLAKGATRASLDRYEAAQAAARELVRSADKLRTNDAARPDPGAKILTDEWRNSRAMKGLRVVNGGWSGDSRSAAGAQNDLNEPSQSDEPRQKPE